MYIQQVIAENLPAFAAAVVISRVIYVLYFAPLHNVPGPFLARFTRLWQFFRLRSNGDAPALLIRLHRKHGPIVRIAPNVYSLDSPSATKAIYSDKRFLKSRFYHAGGLPDVPNLFSLADEKEHSDRKRRVGGMYSMTSVAHYEPAVERVNRTCVARLREWAEKGEVDVDVPELMQKYACDVIGEITIDRSFGALSDHPEGDLVRHLGKFQQKYLSALGIFPALHGPLFRLVTSLPFDNPAEFPSRVAQEQIEKRVRADQEDAGVSVDPDAPQSFLTKMVRAEKAGKLERRHMLDAIGANVAAGTDTTSITLSAAMYYVYRTPHVLAALRREIDEKAESGRISDPVTFAETQKMPYLQATIQEVLRMHPAVGYILPRVVPEGGVEIAGEWFPAGTEVGCSSWVVHRNKESFGPDADVFRPERFLDADGEYHPHAALFAFGAGARSCIGKNISLLEISKVLPQVVRQFDLVFDDGKNGEWELSCWFFVWQDYKCRVRLRQ